MNKIFTGREIHQLDQYTIEHDSISGSDLVERAARVFCNVFCKRFAAHSYQVKVFAGPGNNGADGLAIAHILTSEGFEVEAFLFNKEGSLSPECADKKELYNASHTSPVHEITDRFVPPHLSDQTIVIDALFGSGLNRPLQGGYAALVQYINQSNATVIAVDIPSGLFTEDNSNNRPDAIVCARQTYTFEFPKLAFFFSENEQYTGSVTVLPIGLSQEGKNKLPSPYLQVSDTDISALIPMRPRFSHKGDYGHALLLAGSVGMTGAAILSARAAMRSGLGKLTCHVPAGAEQVLHQAVPEALLSLDRHQHFITHTPKQITNYSTIGVGPGLGQEPETVAMLETLMKEYPKPIVIDADALNILAQNEHLMDLIPPQSILTPHAGELHRLTAYCDTDWQRLRQAMGLAQRHRVFVILKGAYSVTCTPSGTAIFNSTGNPGMATAGAGDVLTGVITALLAQGYPPVSAAILGNYLHGLAGDIYVGNHSVQSLIASDIINLLPRAWAQFKY